jgi:hypothetical protein
MIDDLSLIQIKNEVIAYEPLYQPNQKISSSVLTPLNWQQNPMPDWREFALYVHLYRNKKYTSSRMTGILSPKFQLKTGVTPDSFIEFVRTHLFADVILINPFPQIPSFSYNVWMQGEVAHPGITKIAEDLLAAAGLKWRLSDVPRQSTEIVCYSNFWLGTPSFWQRYVGGVLLQIAKYLENNINSTVSKAVLLPTRHTGPAPYLPFIIERLFSTFLTMQPDLQCVAWKYSPDEILNRCVSEYERILVSSICPITREADSHSVFPENIRNQMQLMCKLWQQHSWDYFSLHNHPHGNQNIKINPDGKV